MKRTLSLVLDDKGYRSLVLMDAESNLIDKFTSSNFESHEDIRTYFKDEIEKYLNDNQKYLDLIRSSSTRDFRGRIVILEEHEYHGRVEYVAKRVLYKKHLVAFDKLVKDKATMQRFLRLEKHGVNSLGLRNLISPFLAKEINTCNFKVVSRVNLIQREIKNSKSNFYDILRLMCKAYEYERKYRIDLPTIESIYKDSQITEKEMKAATTERISVNNQEENFFYIDGVRYSDELPPDIDRYIELLNEGSEITGYRPDGLGPRNERSR